VDSEGWYVGIKEMASGSLRCYGNVEVLNNFKIGVRYGVNLVVEENGNCFCGIMEINIESWEMRYDDFGDSVIWLQLRRIEET